MGEFDLLARLRERLPAPGPEVVLGSGDDAAVTLPPGATATSIDSLVEGIHFRRSTASLASIGHKALAAALSDLAAMGARAGEAYVAVGVPADLGEEGCLELLDGLLALARRTGTTVAGGDVSASPVLSLTIAVVGHAAAPGAFVARSGAREGEVLLVTGELGGAAAGLLLLESPQLGGAVEPSIAEALRLRQTRPLPRLEAGIALARAGASAMIDISDGIGADAGHISEASEVRLVLEPERLPLAAGLAELAEAARLDALGMALAGGEDYELLAAVPEDLADDALTAVTATGTACAVVGAVVAGAGAAVRRGAGEEPAPPGWDQLGG